MHQAPRPPHRGSTESHFPEVVLEEQPEDACSGRLALRDLSLRRCGPDASGRTGRGMGGMAGLGRRIQSLQSWRAMLGWRERLS